MYTDKLLYAASHTEYYVHVHVHVGSNDLLCTGHAHYTLAYVHLVLSYPPFEVGL